MPAPRREKRRLVSKGSTPSEFVPLPFLSEWTNLMFEGPGIAWLLVELPIRFRDGGGPHQAVWIEILDCLRPFPVDDQLPNPFGIDAGVDHQMSDVDIFWTKLTGDRLRHSPQSEFRAGKGRKSRAATHARRGAGE